MAHYSGGHEEQSDFATLRNANVSVGSFTILVCSPFPFFIVSLAACSSCVRLKDYMRVYTFTIQFAHWRCPAFMVSAQRSKVDQFQIILGDMHDSISSAFQVQ